MRTHKTGEFTGLNLSAPPNLIDLGQATVAENCYTRRGAIVPRPRRETLTQRFDQKMPVSMDMMLQYNDDGVLVKAGIAVITVRELSVFEGIAGAFVNGDGYE